MVTRRGQEETMIDPRLENHVTGIELQIVELVEQRERARIQGQPDRVHSLQAEIDELQLELVNTAETLAASA